MRDTGFDATHIQTDRTICRKLNQICELLSQYANFYHLDLDKTIREIHDTAEHFRDRVSDLADTLEPEVYAARDWKAVTEDLQSICGQLREKSLKCIHQDMQRGEAGFYPTAREMRQSAITTTIDELKVILNPIAKKNAVILPSRIPKELRSQPGLDHISKITARADDGFLLQKLCSEIPDSMCHPLLHLESIHRASCAGNGSCFGPSLALHFEWDIKTCLSFCQSLNPPAIHCISSLQFDYSSSQSPPDIDQIIGLLNNIPNLRTFHTSVWPAKPQLECVLVMARNRDCDPERTQKRILGLERRMRQMLTTLAVTYSSCNPLAKAGQAVEISSLSGSYTGECRMQYEESGDIAFGTDPRTRGDAYWRRVCARDGA